MTTLHTHIDDRAEHYLLAHSQHDNSDIDVVFNSAYRFDEPHMQISKLQATALQFFIAVANIRTIVEVGTFVGYSAFAMAKSQRHSGCKILTIEVNPEFHAQAERNKFEFLRSAHSNPKLVLGSIANLEFINADAREYFSKLSGWASEIDMIFLDGDKEHYSFYVDWAVKNLRSGGYLIVDNALFKGGVVASTGRYASGIREATTLLSRSGKFDYFFLPVGDCMIVAKKR